MHKKQRNLKLLEQSLIEHNYEHQLVQKSYPEKSITFCKIQQSIADNKHLKTLKKHADKNEKMSRSPH